MLKAVLADRNAEYALVGSDLRCESITVMRNFFCAPADALLTLGMAYEGFMIHCDGSASISCYTDVPRFGRYSRIMW